LADEFEMTTSARSFTIRIQSDLKAPMGSYRAN
jgi:hypothetical protein